MSAALKILVYLIGTVVIGAALAPWLFWAGQYVSHFQQLGFLANTDFQRYFDRATLISAFLLLLPILQWIGLGRLKSLGLRKNPRRIRHLLGGFAISAGTISALGASLLGFDILELKDPLPWDRLPPIFLTAISVLIILHMACTALLNMVVAEAFPPTVRAMAVSTTYAVGLAIFGGSAQFVATSVVAYTGDPRSIAGIFALATAMSLLMFLRVHRQTTVGVRSSSN